MAKVNLDDVSAEQLMLLGDAALRLGRPGLASRFYTAATPPTPAAPARTGLARAGTQMSQKLLEVLKRALLVDARNAFVGGGLATWLKSPPFAEDARFMEIAARHAHLLPMDNWHWNLQTVLWAVSSVRNV